MKQTTRGRISVDIGRLRVALFEQARAQGVSPSHLVRDILVRTIGVRADETTPCDAKQPSGGMPRVRLSLRLNSIAAHALQRSARRAGKGVGDLVVDLLEGMPMPVSSVERQAQLRALVASNSELATLTRDLRHLTALLGQGSVAAAQRYRDLLDGVADAVRVHVDLSSAVLAELRPSKQSAKTPRSRSVP